MFDPRSRGGDGSEPSTIESIKSIPSIKEELSDEIDQHEEQHEVDVKQEPLSPVADQQTIMMRTIIENNESNPDNSGSFFKFVVRDLICLSSKISINLFKFQVRKKKTNNVVLTPVRRSKRTQKTDGQSAQKAVDEMKVGETLELTDVVDSKTGETVKDDVIIIID